ncbi:MAG: sensor histidine kinase [Flavitalea sp.]
MKKLFPVIIVLITLSLIGTIYVQYNWLRTMLLNKEEELKWNVAQSMFEVGSNLMEQNATLPSLKNFRTKPDFTRPSDQFQMELMKPPTIAQKFTEFEVGEKLRKAFNDRGLKDIQFEFSISSNINNLVGYELNSRGFINEIQDTTGEMVLYYPLQPDGGSDYENLVPDEELTLIVPNIKSVVMNQIQWMIVGSIFFTLIIVSAFYVTIAALLRQKKMSEIKNDFINNMTHEFKTPLATISLAVDAMRNEKVLQDKNKMDYFSGIIKEENKRMNKHVETILQAALMDRQEVQLAKRPMHVHDLLEEVVDNYKLQLQEKKGHIEFHPNAKMDYVEADPVHFRNVLSNLVDNAVKYSGENLLLKIQTSNNNKYLILKFEDNGIGMSKETVRRIFEKFYRAHTGNLHNVKGFGLGLSYVKTIVDAHHGRIRVESTPGRGSTFTLEIPLLRQVFVPEQQTPIPVT